MATLSQMAAPGIRIDKGEYWNRIFLTPDTPINTNELAAAIHEYLDPHHFKLGVDEDPNWRTIILYSEKVMHVLADIKGCSPALSTRYGGGSLVFIDDERMDKHFAAVNPEPVDPDAYNVTSIGEITRPPMEVPGLYTMISLDAEHFMITDFFEYEFKNAESLREIVFSFIEEEIFCYYPRWITMKLAEFQTREEHKRYVKALDELDATRVRDGNRSLSQGVIDIIASYAADACDTDEFRETMHDLRNKEGLFFRRHDHSKLVRSDSLLFHDYFPFI